MYHTILLPVGETQNQKGVFSGGCIVITLNVDLWRGGESIEDVQDARHKDDRTHTVYKTSIVNQCVGIQHGSPVWLVRTQCTHTCHRTLTQSRQQGRWARGERGRRAVPRGMPRRSQP